MTDSGDAFNKDTHLARRFLEIRNEFGITDVIETGTYHGITTEWLAGNFRMVFTVENNAEYFKVATERLEKLSNVELSLEDSADFLFRTLELLDDSRTIVFLDAHWYANPLQGELDAIKKSGAKPVLAIHDFKVPDRPELGFDAYPDQGIVYEWDWIKDRVEDIYQAGYRIEYNSESTGAQRGCIFIFPESAGRLREPPRQYESKT